MIRVVGPSFELDRNDPTQVDTTSRSTSWSRGLSPFLIGPCNLYKEAGCISKNMENAWQFSKVYKEYLDADNNPSKKYWEWARIGWSTERGIRYPMGKGAIPEYSFWNGSKLGYIDARKSIYIPLYSEAVKKTEAFGKLTEIYSKYGMLILKGFDGYDYSSLGMSLDDVINDSSRKMGHMFVLAMLLCGELK